MKAKGILALVSLALGMASASAFAGGAGGPGDGPNEFANSFGYTWIYTKTDNNGCQSCMTYSAQVRCEPGTVGQTMKFRQPGTKDNDYVYTCTATGGGQAGPVPGPRPLPPPGNGGGFPHPGPGGGGRPHPGQPGGPFPGPGPGPGGGMYPYDGPQYFANSVESYAYSWAYTMTDNNGCDSCMVYNPNAQCNAQTVGQKMKSRQPGTRDNDYVYTCQPGYPNGGPGDGPQYFSNLIVNTQFNWRFVSVDPNGCPSCQNYNPQYQCNRQTVGQVMKAQQPRTWNNAYVYQCVQE